MEDYGTGGDKMQDTETNYTQSNYMGDQYPVQNYQKENKKKGLGIAAVILGSLSILCCSCMGMGILPGLIGLIFSIICLAKGSGSGKTLGIVGVVLSGIGVLLNLYMLVWFVMAIRWENVNADVFNQLNNIDPNDEEAIRQWMQQFFKMDISSY